MTRMTKAFNALLPGGRVSAMQAIAVKMLRDSCVSMYDDLYLFIDGIWKDLGSIDGNEMREDAIINWEKQFGLKPAPSDTLQNRRDAIEAAWGLVGSCGPGYIEEALQRAGYDVQVTENIPATSLGEVNLIQFAAHVTALQYAAHGGATQSQFGEITSGDIGYLLGNGYLLLDDGTFVDPVQTPQGTASATTTYFANHGGASQKYFSPFGTSQYGSGGTDWSFVFIIEAIGGGIAEIPTQRKASFEREVLRLKPAHLAVFMRVRYV